MPFFYLRPLAPLRLINCSAYGGRKKRKGAKAAKVNQSPKLCREVVGRRNTLGFNPLPPDNNLIS
jgi:hypothetical protein